MGFSHFILLAWMALVLYATGQIWFAQIVIYPLFAMVGEKDYVQYHHFYVSHITLPVILPGFACFLFPLALLFFAPATVPATLHWLNIALGFVGLAVTLCLLIPRHADLERHGKDFRIIGGLVRNNWLRTAWLSLQAIVAAMMLTYIFAPA